MTLRITGGEFRGRKLVTPEGGTTRPTASRVREAMFSMLGPIHGARVLDLCCGCGSLGLEALSRGADTAVFVDDAVAAAASARENIDTFGIADRADVLEIDALRAVQRLREAGDRFDLILIDAPYSQAPKIVARLSEYIPDLLEPGARVVLEGDRRDPPALDLPMDRERAYRDVLVRLYDAPEDAGEGSGSDTATQAA
ncbi:MAG: 16S rRNA (guanine(966)-N(2))-methyltransferase RsmD [Solirubrobacteraceae bacterium]|nr:16S rRNA (guanine(966)-N(2))-methyltransferase RsmD [Patulibacter sp.]